MSLYVRSLIVQEGAELNNIARNGSDVKFARRAHCEPSTIHMDQDSGMLKAFVATYSSGAVADSHRLPF